MKLALAGALAFVLSAPVSPAVSIAHYPQVHRAICSDGRGTVFRIDADTFLTAEHVSDGGCTVNGEPVEVTEATEELDFAILATAQKGHGLPISCEGFRPGQYYFAAGYAFGWPLQRTVMVRAHAQKHYTGLTILFGPELFVGGMSGGPVMDAKGRVVGIVNARNEEYHVSFSRELKDTSLCK